MTDWNRLLAHLKTQQGRLEHGTFLNVARGCLTIIFLTLIALVEDRIQRERVL